MRAGRRLWLAVLGALAGCTQPRYCPPFQLPLCPDPPPSFASDAQPIINTYCLGCHSPGGEEANRPLVTYADVAKQNGSSGTILNQVINCQMPPPDAPALQPSERDTLLAWLVCGAPNN